MFSTTYPLSLGYLSLLSLSFISICPAPSPFYNPSFDGADIEVATPEWTDCSESETTSNLHPGHEGVALAAWDGNTYLGMVTRGGLCQTCNENVSQQLRYPLSPAGLLNSKAMLIFCDARPKEYFAFGDGTKTLLS